MGILSSIIRLPVLLLCFARGFHKASSIDINDDGRTIDVSCLCGNKRTYLPDPDGKVLRYHYKWGI